jgi:hypothetical protein
MTTDFFLETIVSPFTYPEAGISAFKEVICSVIAAVPQCSLTKDFAITVAGNFPTRW